jgi:hypothetical protein
MHTDFTAFTAKSKGIARRITSPVSICQAFDPNKPPKPALPKHDTTTLWDTGATNSSITKKTITALSLNPVGTTVVNHAGGSSRVNTYLVNIFLPNQVVVAGVLVSECQDVVGDLGSIIGMDIITRGDLALTNFNHSTCMSFRIPSIKCVDYVKEARALKYAGVGRNAPCPCGSGKKFKKCCGKKK